MGVKVREKIKDSGIYWVFVAHQGRRTSRKVGDRKAAREAARKIQARLTLGAAAFPEKKKSPAPTLSTYCERFQKNYMPGALKDTTRESYTTSFRLHILPEFGKLHLDEIDRGKMEEFVAGLMRKNLARDTIRLIIAALGTLYEHAIQHKVVRENPTRNLTKLYKQAPVKHDEIQPLTAEEVGIFLKATLNRKYSKQHYALFLTAIHTGMRSGELAGLQWGDIDWNSKYVTVRRSIVNGKVTQTKTNRIHKVDLSDAVILALQELKRTRQAEWLKEGENTIPEWVFCNERGNPIDMRTLKRRHFKKVLAKAELRKIRFHDLRHTFATLLITQGESLAYVKDQLGHSSIKMTVDTYTHWIPGSNRQAVNRLPTEDQELGEEVSQTG